MARFRDELRQLSSPCAHYLDIELNDGKGFGVAVFCSIINNSFLAEILGSWSHGRTVGVWPLCLGASKTKEN
jgi:hypothetical protein